MKQALFLVVMVLTVMPLSCACAPSSQNSGYVTTDAMSMMYMHWTQQGTNLSGQWSQIQYQEPLTTASSAQPQTNSVAITGTIKQQQIMVQSSGVTLYTGSVTQNGELELNGSNTQGQATQTPWYPLDTTSYNQLVSAFEANIQTSAALSTLSATLNLLPVDSDPADASMEATQVSNDISNMQSVWQATVVNNADQASQCREVALFAPYWSNSLNFQAPDPSQSTLAVDMQQVTGSWQHTQQVPVPKLPAGMHLPWQVTQAQVSAQLTPAQRQLTALQQADTSAQTTLNTLKTQYQTLKTQYQTMQKTCNLS
jgi:hypothetical protein